MVRHVVIYGGIRQGQMKNLLIILLLFGLFSSCNDILEDPDNVREGITIGEELMTSQIWKVEYFSNDPQRAMAGFQGSFLEFNMDNTFDLINSNSQVFTGEWALSSTKDLLVIRSDGKIPEPYNEIENEWIILIADSENVRIQERDPKGAEEFNFIPAIDHEIPNICEEITGLMSNKSWRIQHLIIANNVRTADYEDFEFSFQNGARAIATAGATTLEGSWNAGIRCNKFHLGFYQYEGLKEIAGLWQLSYFTESTIKLVMNRGQLNWEMRLVAGTNIVDNLCEEAESNIRGGSWTVSKFVSGNDSFSDEFSGYFFQFKDEGELIAFNSDKEFKGNWSLVNNCEKIPISIDGDAVLNQINGDWQLVLVSKELLKLLTETENNKKEVRFVRELETVSLCDSLDRLFEKDHMWHVSFYQINNEDLTGQLQGTSIVFSSDRSLTISTGNVATTGAWALEEECKKIDIKAEGTDPVNSLALDWYITKITEEKVILVHESEMNRIELHLTT